MKPDVLAVCLIGLVGISTAAAQNPSPTPNPQSSLIGTAIAATVIVAVFAFVAYAGFKSSRNGALHSQTKTFVLLL